jgi:ferrous-iron efflux pump FieF
MLKWLFSPSKSSYQTKQRSILFGLAFGIIGLFPAIAIVITANSLTVLSDLLRNVGLVFAMLFSWITVRKVAQGKNFVYNYGYAKMENLSSMVVAGVMIISITIIVFQIIGRFQHPVTMNNVGVGTGMVFSALAAIANGWLWWQSWRTAKREPSQVMESVWRLSQIKMISTICVFLSLTLSFAFKNYSWVVYIDPAGSVVLLGFLVFTTYSVISSSVFDLLDRALDESMQLTVLRELAQYFDSYIAIHGVRSRRAGNNVYIELFLEFDPEQKTAVTQQVIDDMKSTLENKIPASHVMIAPTTTDVV